MSDFSKNLAVRITGLQAEVLRVEQKALADVAEIKGQIAALRKAQAALTPENEALLMQIKAMGLL